MSHAVRVKRQKLRVHSTMMSCDALQGVAWRGRCACGWLSPHWYLSREDALRAAREHRTTELGLD